jgi:hypothetical protein
MSATKQHHHDAIEGAMRGKERPILFNTQMVKAILNGQKTQTRRILKQDAPCPFGQAGDRLWVRETWANIDTAPTWNGASMCEESQNVYRADFGPEPVDWNWRPSIHMPRAASRITLEITGIRVERLNDISKSDAVAEGIESFRPVPGDGPAETIYKDYTGKNAVPYFITDPRESFRTLWESINAPGSWGKNPWVWVIDFQDLRNFISPT